MPTDAPLPLQEAKGSNSSAAFLKAPMTIAVPTFDTDEIAQGRVGYRGIRGGFHPWSSRTHEGKLASAVSRWNKCCPQQVQHSPCRSRSGTPASMCHAGDTSTVRHGPSQRAKHR